MQIVIDIPEEYYNAIKKNGYIYEEEVEDVALSIIGGIPLHRQLAEYLKDYERLKEQESCEDYIRVPKKALKYRAAGMVAYNAEWLKNHFDIERAVICGAQEPYEEVISKQTAVGYLCTHCPDDAVIAWMPLPEPYKIESEKNNEKEY